MSKRLLTLRLIQQEKLPRSRSWIFAEMAAGRFPKPIGGTVPNMWLESDIDSYLEGFIEAAKQRASEITDRIAKATAGRALRREALQPA